MILEMKISIYYSEIILQFYKIQCQIKLLGIESYFALLFIN